MRIDVALHSVVVCLTLQRGVRAAVLRCRTQSCAPLSLTFLPPIYCAPLARSPVSEKMINVSPLDELKIANEILNHISDLVQSWRSRCGVRVNAHFVSNLRHLDYLCLKQTPPLQCQCIDHIFSQTSHEYEPHQTSCFDPAKKIQHSCFCQQTCVYAISSALFSSSTSDCHLSLKS